jgi:arylformamidase
LKKYYDISVPISSNLPIWPDTQPIEFQRTLDLDQGDIANDTTICMSVHTGTHVDASLHFVSSGRSVDELPLETLIGPATVIDVGEIEVITAIFLEGLELPNNLKRILFKTKNSRLWNSINSNTFETNFVALSFDAAKWLVNQGIILVGIDYLSIQRFYDGPETHIVFLQSDVVIIEGLNLIDVPTGDYELICLPIKLKGLEGAPSRAILRPLSIT